MQRARVRLIRRNRYTRTWRLENTGYFLKLKRGAVIYS